MRLRTRKRERSEQSGALEGVVRLDKRTKDLNSRIQPGEIVIIDHPDLDRVAAESLAEKKIKAVVNASAFCTGRYPNLGALVLGGAGVVLVENVGSDVFGAVREGDLLTIDEGCLLVEGEIVGKGDVVTLQMAQQRLDESKRNVSKALESFAENTLEYMINEKDFLLEALHLPETSTNFAGRHVLVVVRGYGYKKDLATLRGYIRDFRPVLVAVDGGADALLELKLTPDMIIGDMDSVTTGALKSGAELVVHAFADGQAPGAERLASLGLNYGTFEAPGTSEDIAMLLAHEKGAELIVAVGARVSLVEFMDKGRKGMASTFLVRLRIGPKLVDAKGVGELHRSGPQRWELFGLVGAAVVTMLIVVGISQPMQLVVQALGDWITDLFFAIRQTIS
ncbi:MAG: putative cytokinetic ring protein SteA [Actinomycetota bacterium]